jgi:hsp70-interacting protein
MYTAVYGTIVTQTSLFLLSVSATLFLFGHPKNQKNKTMSEGGGEPSWAWLGLLKWSLAYSDGTRPSEESMAPMSEEDRAFLEAVMKDGIIDENERMKDILKQITQALETKDLLTEEEMINLLLELRDIVEQIDYARAFSAMKGLDFLLGCVSEKEISISFRKACLGVLATMCQNNPPVQLELLNLGSLRILTQLYDEEDDTEWRSKVIQTISANVRSHAVAEEVFCQLEEGRRVVGAALGLGSAETSVALEKRALFLLRALITSDTSSRERVQWFNPSIAYICENFFGEDHNFELREMSLALLEQILEQKHSVDTVLDRKNALISLGIQRVSAIRALKSEEMEYANVELEHWENILVLLARAQRDEERVPLMLQDRKPDDTQTLAQ